MKNKGFTLIELLAVIVILAIIALITVPTILNIINDARIESKKRSIDLYGKSIELAIARKSLTEEVPMGNYKTDGNILTLKDNDFSLDIEYDGERVECDTVKIYEDGTVSLNKCKVDGQYVDYIYGIYTDNSGANNPELIDGLTPVIYDETSKQWKIADIFKEWYDYDKKEWANAVILSETGKDKKVGDILNLPTSPTDANNSDVKAMFVWIPRYEYKMPATVEDLNNPDLIGINFISKNTSTPTEGYVLHPGFTFGSDILSGIWVGKFETSAQANSTCYNTASDTNCNNADQDPYILPNVYSLRYQKVSNQFETAKKFNEKINGDSHMMKDSEWGAVAYLSHSKYGQDGEVYINNCKQYITGIGADNASDSESDITCNSGENKYNGSKGVNASTTGNVYGIYDINGGSWEYAMGVFNQQKGASGFNDNLEGIDEKYYDNYTTTNADDYKGHALGETKGWYSDNADVVSQNNCQWSVRGGYYNKSHYNSGVFYFGCNNGVSHYGDSFRVVLASSIAKKSLG